MTTMMKVIMMIKDEENNLRAVCLVRAIVTGSG